jgi:hypothetical protein
VVSGVEEERMSGLKMVEEKLRLERRPRRRRSAAAVGVHLGGGLAEVAEPEGPDGSRDAEEPREGSLAWR